MKEMDLDRIGKKEILTAAEAAALGYFASAKAAATMRLREKGPPFVQDEWGSRVLYRREDLEEWTRKRRVYP